MTSWPSTMSASMKPRTSAAAWVAGFTQMMPAISG